MIQGEDSKTGFSAVFGFWIACADGVFYNIRVCFFRKKADYVFMQIIGIMLCRKITGAQKDTGELKDNRLT